MEETYETTNLGSARYKDQPKLQGSQTKKLYSLRLTIKIESEAIWNMVIVNL